MPSYKLTYFFFRGLGEPIRLLFHLAGVQFEEVRMNPDQTWLDIKDCEFFFIRKVLETLEEKFRLKHPICGMRDGRQLRFGKFIFRQTRKIAKSPVCRLAGNVSFRQITDFPIFRLPNINLPEVFRGRF